MIVWFLSLCFGVPKTGTQPVHKQGAACKVAMQIRACIARLQLSPVQTNWKALAVYKDDR